MSESNFDWVKERAKCSLIEVYHQLRQDAQENIKSRNAMRPELAHYGFKYVSTSSNRFSVITESNANNKAVDFLLSEKQIEVLSEKEPLFVATVGLNNEGECVLYVRGQELKRWQLLKLALDKLFFEVF
jgi:hypothetical protein